MDRRRMMMGGALLSVVFSIEEGAAFESAKGCRLYIEEKEVSDGTHRIKKGGKILCEIYTGPNDRATIYFGNELVAKTQDKLSSQEISYEVTARENLSVTAEAEGKFYKNYTIRIVE